jgi:hypothetical protein
MRGLVSHGSVAVIFKILGALASALALTAGCSGGGASSNLDPGTGADAAAQATSGPYEPLAVGVAWTYHVNDNGVTYDKTSTVMDTEDAGGPAAGITVFHLVDTFPADKQDTWYQADGLVVKRLHDDDLDSSGNVKTDDWYSPFRLRVDETPEHLVAGATWSLTFTDTHTSTTKAATTTPKTDNWRVDGLDEPVTVPYGTFLSLHVSRTDPTDGSVKSFWFVRGIGKVKETNNSGHLEELTTRTPAP